MVGPGDSKAIPRPTKGKNLSIALRIYNYNIKTNLIVLEIGMNCTVSFKELKELNWKIYNIFRFKTVQFLSSW